MKKLILGMETSCDETALALVEASGNLSAPRFKVLEEAVASQIKVHRPFGGVVPNLAKREHLKNLPILYRKVFGETRTAQRATLRAPRYALHDIDLIAVTVGPGLEPALWAGITFAQELRKELEDQNSKVKIIGANHLEGHLYSFLLPSKSKTQHLKPKTLFPAVALIVSGGHTVLLLVKNLKTWKKLGETRDDAVGEAFDKVARMLRLPYPGGPDLEKLARHGDSEAINFPRPMLHDKSYDFSFSGLKTSVLYYLRDKSNPKNPNYIRIIRKAGINSEHSDGFVVSNRVKADVAASFQQAAVDVLVSKTLRAAKEFKAKSVILSGGVAANQALRRRLRQETRNTGLKFLVAERKYSTDNAVMIAAAAYINLFSRRKKYPLKASGDLNI